MEIHLIDYLAYQLHCAVSDLRSLPRYRLLYELNKISAEECTLQEWTDCAVYLSQKVKEFLNVQEAREYLLDQIGQRDTGKAYTANPEREGSAVICKWPKARNRQ